mmetsp:Transcript_31878/g.53782  ORF Transcript_31878/g.53782 Transcript_31878/m.53782 type:complete len:405 (-) Transcript_31878:298-1512(-)
MVELASVSTCTNTTSVTPEVPSRTNSPPYTSASRITPLVTSWGKVNIPPGPTTAPPNTVSRRTRVSAECPALASSDANELPLRKPPYSVDAGGLCSSSLQLLQFTSQPSIPAASQCSPPSDIVNVSVQSTVPSSEVSQEHKRSSYLNTLYVIAGPYWQERMPRSTKSWSGVSHTVMSLTPFSSLHWQKVAYLAHVGSIFLHPSSHSSSAERWRWREERAMAGERNDARSPSLASAAAAAAGAGAAAPTPAAGPAPRGKRTTTTKTWWWTRRRRRPRKARSPRRRKTRQPQQRTRSQRKRRRRSQRLTRRSLRRTRPSSRRELRAAELASAQGDVSRRGFAAACVVSAVLLEKKIEAARFLVLYFVVLSCECRQLRPFLFMSGCLRFVRKRRQAVDNRFAEGSGG